MATCLIDADIVIFRSAAVSEQDSFNIACLRADDMMRGILKSCDTNLYRAFISGGDNFRYEIDPQYKATRKGKVDPKWRSALKEFLIEEWEAEVTDGIEADDMLGICQTDDTIICSIDKDLLQIPGKHYNFVRQEFIEVSELQGLQWFYQQMLIGDTSDNIIGVKGIGKVKAKQAISPLQKEEEMYYTVRSLYRDDDRFLKNGKLLHIMRKDNDIWEPSNNLLVYYDQLKQELAVSSKTLDQQTPAS